MIVKCNICLRTYDDADCWTLCPHPLLMNPEDLERKKLAMTIVSRKVRFAHQPDGPDRTIYGCNFIGMVFVEGLAGEFAPDLFVSITE